MKITALKDAKDNFSRYVSTCQKEQEPLLVTKGGKPAVLLVPVAADVDVENLVLAWSPRFREMIEQSRERRRQGDSLSFKTLKEELLGGDGDEEAEQKARRAGRKQRRKVARR